MVGHRGCLNPLFASEDSPDLVQGGDSSFKATTGIGFVLGHAHLQFCESVCYIVQPINEFPACPFVPDYETRGVTYRRAGAYSFRCCKT